MAYDKDTTLPSTYRALQITSPSQPVEVITKTTPSLPPAPGTVLLKPLSASVVSYTNEVLQNGNPRNYHFPLPFVPGPSCIARVAAVPTDAPLLRPGQLVVLDPVIRPRDHTTDNFLLGAHGGRPGGPASQIMASTWRDGTFAQVVAAPVENVHVLDEEVLLGQGGMLGHGYGYGLHDLSVLMALAVPYGGLDAVGLRPGETVVVAPATGGFGGAAVHVALAMGAQVIAMGRNEALLAEMEKNLGDQKDQTGKYPSLVTVKLSGSVEGDFDGIQTAAHKLGSKTVDVFFEISPPMVTQGHDNQPVPYITAGIKSLRKGGRVALMGGVQHGVSLPLWDIVHLEKTIRGCWMYTPTQFRELIRLVQMGALRIGDAAGFKCAGVFPLEKWQEAFETAAREGKAGQFVVLEPNRE